MDNKRKALIYFEMDENGIGKTEVRGYERDLKIGLLMLLEKVSKGINQDLKSMLLEFMIATENRERQAKNKEDKDREDLKKPENVIPIDRDKK